jgi:hypothetical protein
VSGGGVSSRKRRKGKCRTSQQTSSPSPSQARYRPSSSTALRERASSSLPLALPHQHRRSFERIFHQHRGSRRRIFHRFLSRLFAFPSTPFPLPPLFSAPSRLPPSRAFTEFASLFAGRGSNTRRLALASLPPSSCRCRVQLRMRRAMSTLSHGRDRCPLGGRTLSGLLPLTPVAKGCIRPSLPSSGTILTAPRPQI